MELTLIVLILLLMIVHILLNNGSKHHHKHHHYHHHPTEGNLEFTFFVNKVKIEKPMSLVVDFGTPITGFISGLNVAGVPADLKDLSAGSLGVASSDETVFKVVLDPATAKFSLNQIAAGTADVVASGINSKGEAVSGKATVTLSPVAPPPPPPPPPDTVVESLVVNFDQATA